MASRLQPRTGQYPTPPLISWLAGALTIAALISVWLALYQWTLQPSNIWIADLPPNARPFANLAQPNQLATLLSMGLAAVLFFYEKHTLHRISSSLLALLLLFGIALTQSRTPWLMAIFLWCCGCGNLMLQLDVYRAAGP